MSDSESERWGEGQGGYGDEGIVLISYVAV